jgi:hypothetical protein
MADLCVRCEHPRHWPDKWCAVCGCPSKAGEVQRPEREAIERLIKESKQMAGLCEDGCYGRCRVCPQTWVNEVVALLAALPPTPTPGPVKELREWLRDEAEFAHQKGWNDRAETLMDVEAKCDDLGVVLPPAPTGERE